MAPVEHARSGDENGAAVAALAQMRTGTAIVAVAGRSRREGGRAGLLGRPRRRARVGCSGIQGSQVPTHRHCGRVRQPGSYVGACSRRCVEVHNGGECGGCWRKRVGRGSVSVIVEGGVGGAGVLAPPMGVGSIRRVPSDREGSTRSVTSNVVESVPLARVSMVCVSPGTCRLARSTRGRTRNRRLAPAASCYVRECCSAAQVRAIRVAAGS